MHYEAKMLNASQHAGADLEGGLGGSGPPPPPTSYEVPSSSSSSLCLSVPHTTVSASACDP